MSYLFYNAIVISHTYIDLIKMKKSYILTSIVLIITLTIVFVAATNTDNPSTNQGSEDDNQSSTSQISSTSTSTSAVSSTEPIDNLTTYTSEILGIKFEYDADRFKLTDYDDMISIHAQDPGYIYKD